MTDTLQLIRPATRPVRSRFFDSAGWDGFPMRGDDIVISTYPKCGTTWMQRIVGMLVFGSADPFAVQDSSPWPDFRAIPPAATAELAASQTHRRFFKSHLPFDALPVHDGVKYIHVARDGRDASMSFFNHKANYSPDAVALFAQISRDDPKFPDNGDISFVPTDPADHFHDWLVGDEDALGDPGASYFAMETSFWEARRDPNVLLVHYNDLKADREGEMRRIADFLDIGIAEDVWPSIVEAAGFDAMKADADTLLPNADQIWEGGGNTFLHKGTNNRWRDVYRAKDLALYHARVGAEFTPTLAAWCESGRLISGDPRDAAD